MALLALAGAGAAAAGCAYLNTFYNARQAYEEGVRLSQAEGDTLPAAARDAFERAAEKSAVVLSRYGDSNYADDALILLGESLYRLGSYADASTTFRRYLTRFPDGEEAGRARLALVRSERQRGDYEAADAALAPLLLAESDGVDEAQLLYEKALIELGTGSHAAAVATFRALLERYPSFAREREVAVRFADAELAAGEYDAALEAYSAFRDGAGDPLLRRELALRIARALSLAGRRADALTAYGEVLEADLPDTLAAEVHAERGDLFAADSAWAEAQAAYDRAAELAPGTMAASRAKLRRGRIEWLVRGERKAALDILLDAFLHAPLSAHGDSARAEARALARVIHYDDLASGRLVVAGIDDVSLARSTALYRLGEEVLDAESDPAGAVAVFVGLAESYPNSPWRARALLAAGLLQAGSGAETEGQASLHALIAQYPDTPEADSARRALGLPVPERPADFYAAAPELVTLAAALPKAEDPMVQIVDQLDRYADRRPGPRDDRFEGRRPGEPGSPVPPGTVEPEPPGSGEPEEEPPPIPGEPEEEPRFPTRPGIEP